MCVGDSVIRGNTPSELRNKHIASISAHIGVGGISRGRRGLR